MATFHLSYERAIQTPKGKQHLSEPFHKQPQQNCAIQPREAFLFTGQSRKRHLKGKPRYGLSNRLPDSMMFYGIWVLSPLC